MIYRKDREIVRSVAHLLWRYREVAAVVAISLIPVVLVVVASHRGPGLTPDSVGYASGARSFATSGQFLYWDGQPVTLWPPGLPLALGLLVRMGIDLEVAAVVLNTLAAGAVVALTYALGRIVLGSARLALVAAAILAVSVSMVHVYPMLWSEPLFCTFCMATLCLLTQMIRRGPTPLGVLAVAVSVSLACSLRYIGVVLIPVTGISLFVAAANRGVVRGLSIGAIGALASTGGALAVALRNIIDLGAPPFGPRSASHYSLIQAAGDSLSTLGHFVLTSAGLQESILAGLLVVGLLVAGAISLARDGSWNDVQSTPVLLFISGYTVLLVASELTTGLEPIDERYLSPVFGSVIVLVVAGVRTLFRSARFATCSPARRGAGRLVPRLTGWSLRLVMAAVGIVFLVGNATGDISLAVLDKGGEVGYNSVQVRSSQLALLAGRSLSGHMVTNDPVLVYWVSGHQPILGHAALSQTGSLASALRQRAATGALTCYAYFFNSRTTQGVSKADLQRAGLVLHQTARYSDGVLYALTVGPAP